MKWLRSESGILFKNGRRISESSRVASGLAALVKGIARLRPWRGACFAASSVLVVDGVDVVGRHVATYVNVHRSGCVFLLTPRALDDGPTHSRRDLEAIKTQKDATITSQAIPRANSRTI